MFSSNISKLCFQDNYNRKLFRKLFYFFRYPFFESILFPCEKNKKSFFLSFRFESFIFKRPIYYLFLNLFI